MSLFLDKSIPALVADLREGRATAVEYAREAAARYREYEPVTHAWVTFDADQLVTRARAADAFVAAGGDAPPLHGLPFGVKDIFNTKTFPTEMGSELWRGFTPGNNARVVDSLLDAGAIVAGKTVTAEFAVHHLNETRNPYDPEATPGTSSSGSAVAVATGVVPFALGSQTAGSIIRPASFCGVWGMKPSFGLIPRTGVLKTTDSLDSIGFLASHAESLRPLLDQARVKGPDYPFVHRHVDARGVRPHGHGPWRIAFVKTHVWDDAEAYVQEAVSSFATALSAEPGFLFEEVALPPIFTGAHDVHRVIYNKSLSYYFEQESRHIEQVSPIMAEMIEVGRAIGVDEFTAALRAQEELTAAARSVFEEYDVVLSPGTTTSAPPRGQMERADPSLMWTLTHLPAVSAPLFSSPDGMPFSCQFVAKKYDDYLLLQCLESLSALGVFPRPRYRRQVSERV